MPAYAGPMRRNATIVAGGTTLVSAALLVLSVYIFMWDLIWELVLWFSFFLSLFHLIFFWIKSITPRMVKMIDYPYLLIGGFSVLLAVAKWQQRER
jgi:hypothetical protein